MAFEAARSHHHEPLLTRSQGIAVISWISLYLLICTLWAFRVDPSSLALFALLPQYLPRGRWAVHRAGPLPIIRRV